MEHGTSHVGKLEKKDIEKRRLEALKMWCSVKRYVV